MLSHKRGKNTHWWNYISHNPFGGKLDNIYQNSSVCILNLEVFLSGIRPTDKFTQEQKDVPSKLWISVLFN